MGLQSLLTAIVNRIPGDNSDLQASISAILLADKKIIDLPALVVQAVTDLFETSANGTASFKESRQQLTDWMSANVLISESQVTNLTTDLAARLLNSANLSDVLNPLTAGNNLQFLTSTAFNYVNSPSFPNLSIGGPLRYAYNLNLTTNAFISLPKANIPQSPRAGLWCLFNNFDTGFTAQLGDNGGTPFVTMPSGSSYLVAQDTNSSTLGAYKYLVVSAAGLCSPTYSFGADITSVTPVAGFYTMQRNIVNMSLIVDIVVSTLLETVTLSITPPIPTTFTTSAQALGGSLTFVDTGSPSILDGSIDSVASNSSTNKIDVVLRPATGAGTKRVTFDISYVSV